jgi:hypothetical protein
MQLKQWQPYDFGTRNGFQTLALRMTSDNFESISTPIWDAVVSYAEELADSWPIAKDIRDNRGNYEIVGWHVTLHRDGYQEQHIHRGATLSGVIHLTDADLSKEYPEAGALVFSEMSDDFCSTKDIPMKYTQSVAPRKLVGYLFPSSLYHHTVRHVNGSKRLCFAFDVVKRESA